MKIAFVGTVPSSLYGFRGALIKLLVDDGHSVFAFSSAYDVVSKDKVRALGATPVDYELSRGGLNPFADLLATVRLSRKLKALELDVCFSYFVKPVIFGTFAAKMARIPRKIAMLEGLGYAFTKVPEGASFKRRMLKLVQTFLYRVALPAADHVIFLNSDDLHELTVECGIKVKAHTVLGGVGLNLNDYSFSGPKLDPFRFIFVGRLLREKGINEYVEAAKKIKLKFPHAQFLVVGKCDSANPGGLTEKKMSELISSGVIDYPGHVTDMSQRLQSSSVFVLPSYREGVPRSTQEAMAVGLPVITTDVPGCRETIVDGETGFLIQPWSVDQLVEKMEYFLLHPDQAKKMGMRGYQMAKERFDVNQTNIKLVEIIFP